MLSFLSSSQHAAIALHWCMPPSATIPLECMRGRHWESTSRIFSCENSGWMIKKSRASKSWSTAANFANVNPLISLVFGENSVSESKKSLSLKVWSCPLTTWSNKRVIAPLPVPTSNTCFAAVVWHRNKGMLPFSEEAKPCGACCLQKEKILCFFLFRFERVWRKW